MENLDTEYVLLCVLRPAPLLYLYHVQYYSLFLSFQLNGVVAHDNLVLIDPFSSVGVTRGSAST